MTSADPAPTPQSPAVPAPRSRTYPEFWMAYWLAVALVLAKMFHFGLLGFAQPGRFGPYFHDLLIATASDDLFALGVGLIIGINLRLLRRRARARRAAIVLWSIVCALFVLYAIVSALVFEAIKAPITNGLLRAAGDWRDMRSSILSQLDINTVVAPLVGGPVAYALIVAACNRWLGVPRGRNGIAIVLLLIVGVVAQIAYARDQQEMWKRREDRRIAQNPHWTLFATTFLPAEPHFRLPADIPPEYADEFRPMRERGAEGRAPHPTPLSGKPRNVIIYALESVSTQFLHIYGSPFLTTSKLDAETDHCIVLDNMYSHVGRTPQSLATICTSNYARPNWDANAFDTRQPLDPPGISLAAVLKDQGFRTLALSAANFRDFHQDVFLQQCGFEQVWDKRELPGQDINTWGKPDAPMVDRLLGWIDQDAALHRPFFALCWTNQTHDPYALSSGQTELDLLAGVRPPRGASRDINRYLNCLAETDRVLGRLFCGLRERGLADKTLVIVVGDHGEAFVWPHNTGYHGYRVYEENVHVPCILWCPGLIAHAKRIETVAGHIDLCPTITDLIGIPPAGTWQGHSLFDPQRPSRAYFYAYYDDNLLGVRSGEWKYIYNSMLGTGQLFNLRKDPQEQDDVAGAYPALCRELRWRVGAWTQYLDQHGTRVKP